MVVNYIETKEGKEHPGLNPQHKSENDLPLIMQVSFYNMADDEKSSFCTSRDHLKRPVALLSPSLIIQV